MYSDVTYGQQVNDNDSHVTSVIDAVAFIQGAPKNSPKETCYLSKLNRATTQHFVQ